MQQKSKKGQVGQLKRYESNNENVDTCLISL